MPGVFVSVVPNKISMVHLANIARLTSLPLCNPDELHCTLVSSSDGSIEDFSLIPNPLLKFHAKISNITVFPAPTIKGSLLVAELDSEDLVERHNFWMNLGLTERFSSYRPHITLSEDIKPYPEDMIATSIVKIKEFLVGWPIVLCGETMTENKYA